MAAYREAGARVAIWGAGSKGVAFLTTLGLTDEVAYAIDINPHKQGMFMPGTGHPVVGPDSLHQSPPDVVIVMNPVYLDEIRSALARGGLDTGAGGSLMVGNECRHSSSRGSIPAQAALRSSW